MKISPIQKPVGSKIAPGPAVSPSAARAIVMSTMRTNNVANAKLDSRLLASYESGSAFLLDNSTYRADRAAKFVPPSSPFSISLKSIAPSPQAGWPASFLAAGIQHSLGKNAAKAPSCGALLDFQRQAPSARWKIVLEPTVNGNALPVPAKLSGGHVPSVSATLQKAADAVPRAMTRALLSEETSGRLGPFTKSDFSGNCWAIPNPRLDVVNAESSGFSQRDLFTPVTPADSTAVALAGGKTLVMFTLRFVDQLVATSASRPISWTHASLSKNPAGAWTYFLGRGTYSQVLERGELEVAVILGPGGKHWSVVGSYLGVTSVTGHRSKATATPGGTLTAFGG
ncbi:MAG: hypothetical protein ACYDGN_02790 [Acidimicrobiales bacterium]